MTLSYFIEPNPSSRGWIGRYVYPSHSLRFDIRRPGETTGEFERRLNKLAEAEEGGTQRSSVPGPQWLVGPQGRQVGSLHADLWEGTAAELADSGVLGVFPVGGWWKNNNRADRTDLSVRYALFGVALHPRGRGRPLHTDRYSGRNPRNDRNLTRQDEIHIVTASLLRPGRQDHMDGPLPGEAPDTTLQSRPLIGSLALGYVSP